MVSPEEKHSRLDLFLSRQFCRISRSKLKESILKGEVLVNGKVKKPGYILKEGDLIKFKLQPEPINVVRPVKIPLKFIYSDKHIIIIDKPSGLVVHPAGKGNKITLVHGLLYYFPEITDLGPPERPGLVHRLDKETSGVMVVARSEKAYSSLKQQFKDREVEKTYLGLVWGNISADSGEISMPIGRHARNGLRISVKTRKPRQAVTLYTVEKRFRKFTLLSIKPVTGRTHQIRVHFAASGLPVVGDRRYGRRKEMAGCPRLFLHAHKLAFRHPVSGKTEEFKSPLPDELALFLQKLNK